ncbi:MAG TPA: gamma-glutamyl-gamma-aminobutyrate hydrolase family protein [Nocardioides sp.]|jgi:gamma-glutamyl-gamma-aminobutyrate hydrolase PuuD|nr:gamma-glutamyl-gamma-aminobutyrate hydrolase family protein [Nocardioides sp.]
MNPTVAVTVGYDLPRNPGQLGVRGAVLETLVAAGASLRLVPALGHPLDDAFYDAVDGLVLPGGPDPHPSRWGEPVHPATTIDEPRDELEYALLAGCLERGVPVLGVCRGLQVVNVALGGTLVQDLPPGPVDHRGTGDRTVLAHELTLLAGSRMAAISGTTRLGANTAHHQAIGRLGEGLVASGWAEDGCVEAIEWATDDRWLVAVQYHPEDLHPADPAHGRLFTEFLDQARAYGRQRREGEEPTTCTT